MFYSVGYSDPADSMHIVTLGRDAEMQYTGKGKGFANFSCVINRGFGDYQKSIWVNATVWNSDNEDAPDFAALIANNGLKGSKMVLSGFIYEDEWEDDQGDLRKSYKMQVSGFGFLKGRGDLLDEPADSGDYDWSDYDDEAEDDEDDEIEEEPKPRKKARQKASSGKSSTGRKPENGSGRRTPANGAKRRRSRPDI